MLRRNSHTARLNYLLLVILSPAAVDVARGNQARFEQCARAADAPPIELVAWNDDNTPPLIAQTIEVLPDDPSWAIPWDDDPYLDEELYASSSQSTGWWHRETCRPEAWRWHVLPAGLIYHSYMAGVHEPRFSLVPFWQRDGQWTWDATLGGRAGIFRYGDSDPFRPQGLQFDFYGAAVSRLDADNSQDLESADYVFGAPLTYGIGNWQFKFGYFHVSSHLGDEHMLRVPGSGDGRINYVRDGFQFGVSYYPHPVWRLYGEVGGAFKASDGAKPFDLQFGTEISPPGPTCRRGGPFLAMNGRLRQEHRFGGDIAVQTGWLWRGDYGSTLRFGGHFYNGKSSQFQFYNQFERHLGFGVWYDF